MPPADARTLGPVVGARVHLRTSTPDVLPPMRVSYITSDAHIPRVDVQRLRTMSIPRVDVPGIPLRFRIVYDMRLLHARRARLQHKHAARCESCEGRELATRNRG